MPPWRTSSTCSRCPSCCGRSSCAGAAGSGSFAGSPRLLAEAYAEALPGGRPGLVLFVQTFGDLVNLHPHVHLLAADGAFGADGTFVELPAVPEALLAATLRAKC